MNKKGIDNIVAVVLIILISIASIIILWSSILPLIRENLVFNGFVASVSTIEPYTVYYNNTNKLNVQAGKELMSDEVEYRRRKSHKAKLGIDKNWLINGIDVKTRFLINSTYAKNRNKKELKSVLNKVKDKTQDRVKIVTTDGLTTYTNLVKKTWGYDNRLGKHKIIHKVVTASKGEGFNIWVERVHNSIRQRTHSFRGLHGSINSAYSLMKGIEIYYNFIKKHEALNYKTPSELAIPKLKFETPNRWLELIEWSRK